jgi:hypothetical protein
MAGGAIGFYGIELTRGALASPRPRVSRVMGGPAAKADLAHRRRALSRSLNYCTGGKTAGAVALCGGAVVAGVLP